MSKTPLISLNDGTSWADAVPKLRTDELGASTTDWVQEGDTKAASLKVTANGTYAAASAGKYGYDYVTVSVKGGSATGIGPDGNEHTVYPDPETGKLIDEVIPSSIVVTTPPTVTTYQDGDTIDFTGIVVTAYTLDGEVWEDSSHPGGVIPVSELDFPVTTAHYDPDVPVYAEMYESSILNGEMPIVGVIHADLDRNPPSTQYTNHLEVDAPAGYEKYSYEGGYNGVNTYAGFLGASSSYVSGSESYTHDNKTVYYDYNINMGGGTWDISPIPPVERFPESSVSDHLQRCAWTMIYGEKSSITGGVSIPVNWQRPGDGAILEATFPINVTPAST